MSLESAESKNILVIGAGIVGVATALWLQRDGHTVTLIDKEGPGAGASQGNAGVLASGSLVPVTVPGLLKKAPGMLMSKNQPLFLKWAYLPKLIPFLFKYMKNANAKSAERISQGLSQLLHDAPDQHLALAHGTEAARYIGAEDYLFGYANKAAFSADRFGWGLRARRGVDFEELDAGALGDYDPNLAGRFGYGVQCKNHGRIKDPGAYVTKLADHFVAQGGALLTKEIKSFDIEDGHCKGIATVDGRITADVYVLTTGAWSSAWQKELGVTVPMESERGYHIEFVNPSITLRSPLMVAGGKFVVHSMEGRMRCAGVIEFGGLENPASSAPIKLLKKQMADLFPEMTYDRIDEWMGHRPATADSLPVIGPSPNAANIFLGYGHQHIGLSGGPKTGRWLAKLSTGAPINTDLTDYAANRRI
jgi:D-amino-acid dehydrogenase